MNDIHNNENISQEEEFVSPGQEKVNGKATPEQSGPSTGEPREQPGEPTGGSRRDRRDGRDRNYRSRGIYSPEKRRGRRGNSGTSYEASAAGCAGNRPSFASGEIDGIRLAGRSACNGLCPGDRRSKV